MAAHTLQSIYQVNANSLFNLDGTPATEGVDFSFTVDSFISYTVDTMVYGVQMNSVLEVLPSGLNQPSNFYYTPATVTQIVLDAND